MSKNNAEAVHYSKDSEGIATLHFDAPDGPVNIMNELFQASFKRAVTLLEKDSGVKGILITSGKKTFYAGADLKQILNLKPSQAEGFYNDLEALKQKMRVVETMGIPVVTCINGTALGGGWELAMMGHHRLCIDNESTLIGLPEVTLGLLPGAGGITKMVRLLGLEAALPFLTEGKKLRPQQALKAGFVHGLCASEEEMIAEAKNYIRANPESCHPFDVKGYRIPGFSKAALVADPKLMVAPAMITAKSRGCYPAVEKVLATAIEGLKVDVETSLRIESRYLTELSCSSVAKNLIGTLFFKMNAIKGGFARGSDEQFAKVEKLGILGAGMMGAGIAFAAASKGITVVLKDKDQSSAESGKAKVAALLEKQLGRGRRSPEEVQEILGRITATGSAEDLAGSELIIEAVYEQRDLKATVTQEAEAYLAADGIMASNTSTLPISGLAQAAKNPAKFIGLHFFSPVDKMQLVEIITGEKTDAQCLARAFDFVKQIAKVPIVVRDSRGFYTSRVFATYANEGLAILGEGIPASAVERAAVQVGMPVGPLAVSDEVSLKLMDLITTQTKKDFAAEGKTYEEHPAEAVVAKMLGLGRPGRAGGAGFYDYSSGSGKSLWQGLHSEFKGSRAVAVEWDFQDLKDRLLFVQALEAVRCYEQGVVQSVAEADVGSILGIGFPPWTGGCLQFVNSYGVQAFADRALELSAKYGKRFHPPKLLMEHAESAKDFVDEH